MKSVCVINGQLNMPYTCMRHVNRSSNNTTKHSYLLLSSKSKLTNKQTNKQTKKEQETWQVLNNGTCVCIAQKSGTEHLPDGSGLFNEWFLWLTCEQFWYDYLLWNSPSILAQEALYQSCWTWTLSSPVAHTHTHTHTLKHKPLSQPTIHFIFVT